MSHLSRAQLFVLDLLGVNGAGRPSGGAIRQPRHLHRVFLGYHDLPATTTKRCHIYGLAILNKETEFISNFFWQRQVRFVASRWGQTVAQCWRGGGPLVSRAMAMERGRRAIRARRKGEEEVQWRSEAGASYVPKLGAAGVLLRHPPFCPCSEQYMQRAQVRASHKSHVVLAYYLVRWSLTKHQPATCFRRHWSCPEGPSMCQVKPFHAYTMAPLPEPKGRCDVQSWRGFEWRKQICAGSSDSSTMPE